MEIDNVKNMNLLEQKFEKKKPSFKNENLNYNFIRMSNKKKFEIYFFY